MEGFDVLGAVEFEEYLVGAVIPSEKPTLTKLSKASSKTNAAASKLARLESPKAKRAAQKLRAHASAAVTKGQKLSKAIARARSKAATALTKPEAKPFVAQAATRAAQYAERAIPAVVVVPTRVAPVRPTMRTSASAPTRSMQTPRAAMPTAPARRGASKVQQSVSVLGLGKFQLQAAANWVGPMLDVYNAFANAMDDASVAGEVWTQVGPLVDQLSATNPSHPLVNDGNDLLLKANAIIDSVQVPSDPPTDGSGDSVGWNAELVGCLVGDVSGAAMSLQVDAIAWIKQARLALGQWGTPAASAPTSPPGPVTPEMPPMNQSTPASSGGGGGSGGGGDEGGGGEEGAPAEEDSAQGEGGEEQGYEEEGAYEEGGDYAEEGEEGYYATQGGGAGVQGVMDGYDEDADYAADASDEDGYSEDEEGEYASDETEGEGPEETSALEALSLIGHGGGHGGGGHGGGGHGGHGGGHRGGGRGMRGGWGGPWYGGPWYDGYGYDVLLEDDEELADKIAKKVAQRQWVAGAHVGYVAPETHWYTIATPGAIKAEMDKVLREGETLAQDIASYHGGAASFSSFKAGWDSFWSGYKKFYEDTGWLGRLTGSAGDQVVAYGNQLNDWRAKLKQFPGAMVTEPSVTAIERREDPTKFNYMPLVYGGIAVAALVGGGYALSHVSAIAALFSRKKTA